MSTTTSNAALVSVEMMTLLHEFYAVGATILARALNDGTSNTNIVAAATQIKADRVSATKTNANHVTLLQSLAAI